MPAKGKTPVDDIFQIKVTLSGSHPPIWRRLLVPANLTLAALHNVLLVAMGWDGSHLYEFRKGKQFWGRPNPEDRFFDLPPTINDRKVRLDEVLLRARSSFVYTYDMGDRSEERRVGKECRSRWSP